MAKDKKNKKGQGGHSLEEQTKRLKAKMSEKEILDADEIVEGYSINTIRLAFKTLVKNHRNPNDLGKADQAAYDSILAAMNNTPEAVKIAEDFKARRLKERTEAAKDRKNKKAEKTETETANA